MEEHIELKKYKLIGSIALHLENLVGEAKYLWADLTPEEREGLIDTVRYIVADFFERVDV